MKRRDIITASYRWLFVSLLTCCLSACIRQDMSDCPQHTLQVKVVDADGVDITEKGVLKALDIYLYDKSGFARKVPVESRSMALINEEACTIVGWGNIHSDTLSVSEPLSGAFPEESRIGLLCKENGCHLPLTNLFYGSKQVDTKTADEETITLVLAPAIASVCVYTKNLQQHFGTDNTDYRLLVRSTGDALDFLNRQNDNETRYEPNLKSNEAGDVYAEPFHVLPAPDAGGIAIDLMQSDRTLVTVTGDKDGNPLSVPAGRLLRVDIEFSKAAPGNTEIEVTASVLPWEEEKKQNTAM